MRRTLDAALRRQIRAAAPAPAEEPDVPVWKPGFGEEAEPPAAVRLPGEEPEESAPAKRGRPAAEGLIRRAGAKAPVPDPQGCLLYTSRRKPFQYRSGQALVRGGTGEQFSRHCRRQTER